jgi:phage gp36-like protein
MSYATVADIESEFKSIDFTTGALVTSEVTEFLNQTDALIDAYLNQRYVLPITDADSLLILKKIEIDFVAYRVAKILNLKKEIPLPDKSVIQDLNNAASFKQSKELLEKIFDGEVILPGATPKASSGGFSDYNSANSIEPIFERDTKQW